MLIRVWEYDVPAGYEQEFAAVYGADGDWAALFTQGAGFVGTELFASTSRRGRYLTVDRFASRQAWEEFLDQHRAAYDALDRRCAHLTRDEREIASLEA